MENCIDRVNYYELDEEDFKKEFFNTMNELANNTIEELKTYIVYGFQNETNWCGTGINIRALEFNANNKYDFWLQINKYFESKKSHYLIYNYDWYMELLSEEIDDDNENIQYDMIEIIDMILDQFKNNDSFWYSSFPPNK